MESLQLRVAQLQEELEEAQNNLYRAAECGNTLLSTNQLLNDKLETREKEYAEQIEELQQENYSLRMKLEYQQMSSSSLQQELEATLAQLKKEHSMHEKRLAGDHSKKMSELTLLNSDLRAEISKLNVQIKTFQERIKKQEEIIEQLREEATCHNDASMLHNELMDLENLYSAERARCEGMEIELLNVRGQLEVAMVESSSLQQRLSELEEECAESNKMVKEGRDALQISNDRIAELASQLELLKSSDKGKDEHYKTGGNSLFGEVDDRRVDVERKMISLKIKYESMERNHSTIKQQLKKMKAEMSTLLCQCSATAADSAQVQRLERALRQSKGEIQVLSAKLHHMELQQAEGVAIQDAKKYMSAFVELGDKAEYIHFLEQELDRERKSHASVINELELKRTQLLWETNKLSDAEAKLYRSQQEEAQLRKEQSKLCMRLQERRENLEHAETKYKQLEAENEYLRGELKQKGKNKQTRESILNTTLDNSKENLAPKVMSQKPAAALLQPLPPAHQHINILEELDKELNKKAGGVLLCKTPLDQNSGKAMEEHADQHLMKKSPEKKVIRVGKDSVNKCPQQ